MNKFSRRDMQALERENAALRTELAAVRASKAQLEAQARRVVDELAKTEAIHHHPDGTTRRGRFFDVLAMANIESLGVRDGGHHVE